MEYEDIEINSTRWFDLKLLLNEEFRDVEGYENLYKISNYGRLKSLNKKFGHRNSEKEKIISCKIRKDGYIQVELYKNSLGKTKRLHNLVAKAFLINPDNLSQVNHKDENKQNNRVDNLEYCTAKYNMNYGTRNKRAIENTKKYKINQYDLNGNFIKTWDSVKDICNELKIKKSKIYNCGYKKCKQAGGYIWEFLDKKLTRN